MYTQSFINQDGKHSAGFQCNQMHQVALTAHDINTHSFYESLRQRKIKHITIRLMSNSINNGEKKEKLPTWLTSKRQTCSIGAIPFIMTTTSHNTNPTLPSRRLTWPSLPYHTLLVNILRCVRLYIKRKYYYIIIITALSLTLTNTQDDAKLIRKFGGKHVIKRTAPDTTCLPSKVHRYEWLYGKLMTGQM